MTPLDIAQAVSVVVLLLIAILAVNRLIALVRAVRKDNDLKEEDEAAVRDVRQADDPGA